MEWNNALMSTFTITQLELGAALIWEPAVGTPEHENLIDTYIAGPGTLQQKRATIALDFFDMVAASALPAPFSRIYHVSINAYLDYSWDWSPLQSTISSASSWSSAQPSSSSTPSSSSGSLKSGRSLKSGKRRREDASPSSPSTSSKRLPGFSIMTKDGVDITDNHSRGPKSKEQREQAAKMRKLGACPGCKRSKQKCEPSHHRPSVLAQSDPMSATVSSGGSWPYETPSLDGSRVSVSPQTSLDYRFSPVIDNQPLVVSHSGRSFSPISVTQDHALPSWDFFGDIPSFDGSRVSVSPQISLDDHFSPVTDNQPLVVSHSGRRLSPISVTREHALSPWDFSGDTPSAGSFASISPPTGFNHRPTSPAQSVPMSDAVSSSISPVDTVSKMKRSSQAGTLAQSVSLSAAGSSVSAAGSSVSAAGSSGISPVDTIAKMKQSSQAGIAAQSVPMSAAVSSGISPVDTIAKTRQSSQDGTAGSFRSRRSGNSSSVEGRLSTLQLSVRKISQGLGMDKLMDQFMGAFSRLGIA